MQNDEWAETVSFYLLMVGKKEDAGKPSLIASEIRFDRRRELVDGWQTADFLRLRAVHGPYFGLYASVP